jgi:hypothetical protein
MSESSGIEDIEAYAKLYGDAAVKVVIQDELHGECIGFHPGTLLEKLQKWNGVFKAKMQEATRSGRKKRRVKWRSIDAK